MVSIKYFLEVCEARYLKSIPNCEVTFAKLPGPELAEEVLTANSCAFVFRLASLEPVTPLGAGCARRFTAQKHARNKSVDEAALQQFAHTFQSARFPEFSRRGN